jgi:hypothetical protein
VLGIAQRAIPSGMAHDLATSTKLLAAQSRQSQLIGSTNQTLSGCSPLLMHPSRVCVMSGAAI